MEEILRFLIKSCSFLFKTYHFKFTDSGVSESFGDAYLVMSSTDVNIRFVSDKGKIFMDFQSRLLKKDYKSWYSFDIVRKYIYNEKKYFSIMDKENSLFLEQNFKKIIEIFNPVNVNNTINELKKIEKIRTNELFDS